MIPIRPSGSASWANVRTEPSVGASFSRRDPVHAKNLENVSVSGTFANVRDNRGGLHTVSVDASWTGTGPLTTTVNGPGSKRKQRSATAAATIVFDNTHLVNGDANFPFPAPFIRVDTER